MVKLAATTPSEHAREAMNKRFMDKIPIGIVGLGKIAVDQHIPAIRRSRTFGLAAIATLHGRFDAVPTFKTLEQMLEAHPEIEAVSLCVPPQPRYDLARTALYRGKHVLLEKPPATSVVAARSLAQIARDQGLSLFATWHSQHAAAVEPTRLYLKDKNIRSVKVTWKEDVRVWHPGQEWIWQAGNLGVFDPGINAISILTTILPHPFYVDRAALNFPANRETPISANVSFRSDGGYEISAEFDWAKTGAPCWEIEIITSHETCKITRGGSGLEINRRGIVLGEKSEYSAIYYNFAGLIARSETLVDLRPLQHVADAFMLGKRKPTEAFF